jgi:hypothetical protein
MYQFVRRARKFHREVFILGLRWYEGLTGRGRIRMVGKDIKGK